MNQPSRQLAVSVCASAVTIELFCGDEYEAQVLYDDIVDRLNQDGGVTLGVATAAAETEKPRST